jgi:hypothetical protein
MFLVENVLLYRIFFLIALKILGLLPDDPEGKRGGYHAMHGILPSLFFITAFLHFQIGVKCQNTGKTHGDGAG